MDVIEKKRVRDQGEVMEDLSVRKITERGSGVF